MTKQIAPILFVLMTGASAAAPAPVVDLNSSNLETRLEALERIVANRTESQQRMQQQLDFLQSDIDEIRGSIELHNHQLEQVLQRQRELYLELDTRFDALKQSASAVSSNVSNINQQQPTVSSSSLSESDAYQAAVNLILKDKNYEDAIPALRQFLVDFPNSSYTDNGYYWLGQLLFNEKNWSEAEEPFLMVATKFADSPKRSDSLLKLGLVEKARNNLAKAQQYFEQVVKEYPNSTPSRLASEQLKNL